ncbi:MAG: VWA domain-containing protein [Streptosporangiales bacterium]|nr:VWA domain-containing protein [Streptosporangiales bacterium]
MTLGSPDRDATEVLLGFARVLRHAGVDASPERVQTMLEAVGELRVTSASDVYWAGRVTLCAEPDDLPTYDEAFATYFGADLAPGDSAIRQAAPRRETHLFGVDGDLADGDESEVDETTTASSVEVLRHRDVAHLSPAERAELRRLVALLQPFAPDRVSRRNRPSHRGRVDVPRTVRRLLRSGGEVGTLGRHTHRRKPRRLVLLVDVSGSMRPYSDALLRFAHVAVRLRPATTEVFTVGTRLTRITRELRQRDPDEALAAGSRAIPDWSGGTRLGEAFKAFLDRWGQRGTARQAVVAVFSDGWERGDADLLGEQMHRLSRLARRVVWVNPHKGKEGFAPLTAGMVAALPYVDELVAGHSLAALEQVVAALGRR